MKKQKKVVPNYDYSACVRLQCEIARNRVERYKAAYRAYQRWLTKPTDKSSAAYEKEGNALIARLDMYERKLKDGLIGLDDSDIKSLQFQTMYGD